ncbi:LysR family transcriptional regulator [Pantoea sp. Acro-805]|uniref:LysR family transcriptional regulator n=1 Tax=Candidatus Pantoea formicae TaxID=2608355 RepID=A0ABX0QZK8_9GAMM|nr:LysR family transcriptional regulator [Pantoea formicae]MDF7651498.1 LysR family transcriptional regulator [Erwiniaceae bacterium L1_54_3]NIF00756.1 LysR family transcriptional regulator [Pantoea formicae]
MDIKLLRAFVTLAQTGSYHAAADILCVTQPALTKQIQTLEHFAAVTLFQRGRHGALLTVAGEQLLPAALDIVARHTQFLTSVAALQQGHAGKLTLGFGISFFRVAPERVAAFRSVYPGVQVTLNDMPSALQCQQLIEGRLQIGFVRLPVPAPLQTRVLGEEQLVLAVAAHNGATATALIESQQMLQLSPSRGEGLTSQAQRFLSSQHLQPRTIGVADDIQTLLALVAAGDGVALLPASVVHVLPAGVKLLNLVGEHTHWQTGIAWHAQIKDPLRDNFLRLVSDV